MQIIYERALTAFPLTQHLWLEYARYVEAKLHRCHAAMLHVGGVPLVTKCAKLIWVRQTPQTLLAPCYV
jgi:hypothetical protein